MSCGAGIDLYFGHEWDDYACDKVAIMHIDRKLLRHKEPRLYDRKWWDYRFLHPTKATYYFAHCYAAAYRRAFAKKISADRAGLVKGLKHPNIFKLSSRDYVGLWKARQKADEIGAPYSFYIGVVLNWTIGRGWKRLPRPSQLYSDDMLYVAWAAWNRQQRTKIVTPVEPVYLARNFTGHPYQVAFQKWLCDRIKERPHPEFALAHYLKNEILLCHEIAAAEFDESTLQRAARLSI